EHIAGGHFFIDTAREQVVGRVVAHLEHTLALRCSAAREAIPGRDSAIIAESRPKRSRGQLAGGAVDTTNRAVDRLTRSVITGPILAFSGLARAELSPRNFLLFSERKGWYPRVRSGRLGHHGLCDFTTSTPTTP